jgi:hypothetical protein
MYAPCLECPMGRRKHIQQVHVFLFEHEINTKVHADFGDLQWISQCRKCYDHAHHDYMVVQQHTWDLAVLDAA